MAKITSQQCYRLVVTPGMFLDQLKKKNLSILLRFHKKSSFFCKMEETPTYTSCLLNSPVTLERWIFRFHEWILRINEWTFLFNYTKKEIQEGAQQHKHPLTWSLKPDHFCDNIQFSQKLWGQLQIESQWMPQLVDDNRTSDVTAKSKKWAMSKCKLKHISLFPELRHSLWMKK